MPIKTLERPSLVVQMSCFVLPTVRKANIFSLLSYKENKNKDNIHIWEAGTTLINRFKDTFTLSLSHLSIGIESFVVHKAFLKTWCEKATDTKRHKMAPHSSSSPKRWGAFNTWVKILYLFLSIKGCELPETQLMIEELHGDILLLSFLPSLFACLKQLPVYFSRFRRMLQCCFAVKLQKCWPDSECMGVRG